jgi:hypothetical protein
VGSIEKRLDAVEMGIMENAILEALVQMEIQEILRVLEASEAIEDSLYKKVVGIFAGAGYIKGDL